MFQASRIRASTLLYILDMVCMLSAISLVTFVLYVFPYIVLGYEQYEVPLFVVYLKTWFDQASISHFGLITAFLSPFILAAVAFMFVSRLITYYLETHGHEPGVPHIDQSELDQHRVKRGPRTVSTSSTALIVGLMVGILALVALAEYFVVISVFK